MWLLGVLNVYSGLQSGCPTTRRLRLRRLGISRVNDITGMCGCLVVVVIVIVVVVVVLVSQVCSYFSS